MIQKAERPTRGKKTRQNVEERYQYQSGGTKRTVVVMLVRAVGVAPLWKDSAALCIAGSRVLARIDFGVCGGSVAGYMVNVSYEPEVLIFVVWVAESRQ